MPMRCLEENWTAADWWNDTTRNKVLSVQETILYRIVFPVELCVGFLCQLINLWVLHGRKIRSLSYTTYLKGLSTTYLMTIPFLGGWVLRKAALIDVESGYFVVFYYGHLERFCANLFLFSGNLLMAALAFDTVYGVFLPLRNLVVSHRSAAARGLTAITVAYTVTALVLIPLPFLTEVRPIVDRTENGSATDVYGYCVAMLAAASNSWLVLLSKVTPFCFEMIILLIVMALNSLLFVEYRKIVNRHRRNVRQLRESVSRSLNQNHAKAAAICLGSVTAYLISNFPSALKEALYLHAYIFGETWLTSPKRPFRPVLVVLANIALMSNFTLIVCLQYLVSRQYRHRFRKLMCTCRRWLLCQRRQSHHHGSYYRSPVELQYKIAADVAMRVAVGSQMRSRRSLSMMRTVEGSSPTPCQRHVFLRQPPTSTRTGGEEWRASVRRVIL